VIEAGDAKECGRLAHTVKGAMRFFGAEAAIESGLALENLGAAGDLTSAPELLKRLNSEVEPVLLVLQRFLETGEM
jgi:HPt (histidine-containing phosphotransfer) domain-containing protein